MDHPPITMESATSSSESESDSELQAAIVKSVVEEMKRLQERRKKARKAAKAADKRSAKRSKTPVNCPPAEETFGRAPHAPPPSFDLQPTMAPAPAPAPAPEVAPMIAPMNAVPVVAPMIGPINAPPAVLVNDFDFSTAPSPDAKPPARVPPPLRRVSSSDRSTDADMRLFNTRPSIKIEADEESSTKTPSPKKKPVNKLRLKRKASKSPPKTMSAKGRVQKVVNPPISFKSIPVDLLDTDGKTLLATFGSQRAACTALHIDKSKLSADWKNRNFNSPVKVTVKEGMYAHRVVTLRRRKPKPKRTASNTSPFQTNATKQMEKQYEEGDGSPRAVNPKRNKPTQFYINEYVADIKRQKKIKDPVYAFGCTEMCAVQNKIVPTNTCIGDHAKGSESFLTCLFSHCKCQRPRPYCMTCLSKYRTKMEAPSLKCWYCREKITGFEVLDIEDDEEAMDQ